MIGSSSSEDHIISISLLAIERGFCVWLLCMASVKIAQGEPGVHAPPVARICSLNSML